MSFAASVFQVLLSWFTLQGVLCLGEILLVARIGIGNGFRESVIFFFPKSVL